MWGSSACNSEWPHTTFSHSSRVLSRLVFDPFCFFVFFKETRRQSCCSCLAPHPCITGMDFDTRKSSLRKRAAASPPSTWGERTWIQRDGSSADRRKTTERIFFFFFFVSPASKVSLEFKPTNAGSPATAGCHSPSLSRIRLLSPEPVAQRLTVRVLFCLSEGIQSGGCFGYFMRRIRGCDFVAQQTKLRGRLFS